MQPGGLHLVPLSLLDESAISHLNIQDIGVNSHLVIDAHIADGTIHFTEGSIDHGNLQGLADDDHINYFFALGRAGGQFMIGGTNPADGVTIQSNTTNTGAGRINMLTPIEFGAYSTSTAVYGFNYEAVESFTGAFVGGGLNFSGAITFSNGTFIYESFRGAPTINTAVNPGFAAYTVLQALPLLNAGSGAGHNPLNPVVINAGPVVQNTFAGTRSNANVVGLNFAPMIKTTLAGAVHNVTNMSGLVFSPKFSTVAGSTVAFGTIRGLHCQNPGAGLFQPGAGTEGMTAWYGLDANSIPFGGNVAKAVVRSALLAASNSRFLLNNGGAESEFGNGDIHLNDGTWIKYGAGITDPDIITGWQASESAYAFSTFFGLGANALYLEPTVNDEWIWRDNSGGTGPIAMQFDVEHVSFGEGAAIPGTAEFFVRFQGPNNRGPNVAGFYSDVLWTAGGLIDVNGLAMTEVNGFRVDANVTVLNGGSVQDQSTMFLAGMGFPGSGAATRLQTLRVTGRSRMDGLMNYNEAQFATLTANVAARTLPVTNSARFMMLQDADANGPWTIQGIVNDQPGDAFYIINDGANAFLLGHQDVAAAAADRIISPTGVDLLLGPDEMAKLWYDPVATRWRILETTGA